MKILFADYETGLLAGRKHEEEVLKKNHPDWVKCPIIVRQSSLMIVGYFLWPSTVRN